jgi:hypothetical protein
MALMVHGRVWGDTLMLYRKFWLHYHKLRFFAEVVAALSTAALFSYWILEASR